MFTAVVLARTLFRGKTKLVRASTHPTVVFRNKNLLVHIIVWLSVATALADPVEAPTPPSDAALIEQIIAGKKQLDEKGDLDEAVKSQARELFDKALAEMEKAKAAAALIAKFERQVQQAGTELDATKAALASMSTEPKAIEYRDATLAEIEQEASTKGADLEQLRKELAEVDAELKGRAGRRAELPKRLSAAQQVLTEVNNDVKALAEGKGDQTIAAARKLHLSARRRAAEREISACELELKALDARTELLPLLRDLGVRRAAFAEGEIKRLQQIVNDRRKQEAEQQRQKAAREQSMAHPAVQQLLEDNTKLAEQRKLLVEQIADASRHLDNVDGRLDNLRKDFVSIKEKVDAVGLADVVGILLRNYKAALPSLRIYRANVAARRQALGKGQLDQLEYQEQRNALADPRQLARDELKKLDSLPQGDALIELEAVIHDALLAKREYLDSLLADHGIYYDTLLKLKKAEQDLIDETERCRQFIDERVLWIASAAPIGVGDLGGSGAALRWLIRPAAWLEACGTLAADAWRRPLTWIVALTAFLMLIVWRRRIRARIEQLGDQAARGSCCRFLPTIETAALTLLSAAAWPGIAWWLGWRLTVAGDVSVFCKAIGAGLTLAAGVYFVQRILWRACCGKGLAEAHFGWSASALRLLRQNLRWIALIVLPLTFVTVAMGIQENAAWGDSLGRICFVAALACFALFTQRILRPTGGLFQAIIANRPGGWLDRFRYVVYAAAVGIPASLAVLAAAGYYYTAQHLAMRLATTVCLLVGLVLLRALLLRWILVNKRKLAIEEARRRRAAQSEAATGDESPTAELPASSEPDRNVAVIDAQTRRLIGYTLAMAGALALWFAWVDVLPALNILNTVPIPHTSLTLAHLGLAALVLATTLIAAKNIPGLLEMAILQHLPLDAGARYAVATVSRYLITIAGTIFCFAALGVEWSKVQWLVAAMSLGLGFGLQEIFANFVSGLIILFERPVRVGDVVTIGEVSGVVSRIRIRATTITDWDRKELVIPNKEFITGRVLNWTLTNQTNRVVVEVGVAYGSDTELTTKILLGIAQNHPLILADPPPHVVFDAFGASSLNFVMRCYLPNLENRLTVIHELHMAVDREFRAAGIEIAFPQQDIHIRSIDVPVPAMPAIINKLAG
ncbi:MAG: mechanosensitive ion channel [Pirellulales bacterium]|nr:mechanosensitive ion channel [Pirellulales bacterium]